MKLLTPERSPSTSPQELQTPEQEHTQQAQLQAQQSPEEQADNPSLTLEDPLEKLSLETGVVCA